MTTSGRRKLSCYVDETGQDTGGAFFLVAVVVTAEERNKLTALLERIEQTSGKGRVKWTKTEKSARLAYIRIVLAQPMLKGSLFYAHYHHTTQYVPLTVLTTARAILAVAPDDYRATIFIDGLPRSKERWFGSELRHLRIATKKVRGVRREENDALMRLADALAGFVRAALEKKGRFPILLRASEKHGFIKEL